MAALLAILTFVLFVGLDYLISRRKAVSTVQAPAAPIAEPGLDPIPALEPVWVAGYQMPEQLHYHRGHTWARVLSADTVAIGVDDFARRLVGHAAAVEVPEVGAWVRQGGPGARLGINGRQAGIVAPVEGEVVEVNQELAENPGLATDDPYGRGWLYKVRTGNLPANLRNLLNGSLAHRWMEDAREQLEVRLMALSGSVLQDGGEIATDFSDHLEDKDWNVLVERFLLT
jgi:glycine cleavage system H protein